MSWLRLIALFTLVGFFGPVQATLIGDTVTAEVQFNGITVVGSADAVVNDFDFETPEFFNNPEFDFTLVDIAVFDQGAFFYNILGPMWTADETFLLTGLDWVGQSGEIVGIADYIFHGLSIDPILATGPHSLSVTILSGTEIWDLSDEVASSPVDGFPEIGSFVGVLLDVKHGVPEPSIIALFAAGLFGLGFARRRMRS